MGFALLAFAGLMIYYGFQDNPNGQITQEHIWLIVVGLVVGLVGALLHLFGDDD